MALTLSHLTRLTAKSLKAVIDVLDLLILDTANISHEVGVVASAVGNLLVDVVVAENLVNYSEELERTKTGRERQSYLYAAHLARCGGCR